MNPRDFEHATSGKVIKAGPVEAPYWAYCPAELPPNFTLDLKLSKLLSEADRALGELAGLGRNLPNPSLFVSPFLRREAVLSSRIEGTQSDLTDLYFFEAKQGPLPGMEGYVKLEEDTREVYNYVQALEHGLKRLDTLPVSLRLLCEIHELLLMGVRGENKTPGKFREKQNWIGGADINSAIYVPPPIDEMKTALYALENYLHTDDEFPPLIRLAFIHYQFEAIHPFVDGNGRIGRLLLSLLMVNWQLLPIPLLYLSPYFEHHRPTYYDLLLSTSQYGNWKEWIEFFLQGVVHQSKDTILRAKRLQDLQSSWRNELLHQRAPALTVSAMEMLFEMPLLFANMLVAKFGIAHQSAMGILRRLEALNIIQETTGQHRNRIYIAPAIFAALE